MGFGARSESLQRGGEAAQVARVASLVVKSNRGARVNPSAVGLDQVVWFPVGFLPVLPSSTSIPTLQPSSVPACPASHCLAGLVTAPSHSAKRFDSFIAICGFPSWSCGPHSTRPAPAPRTTHKSSHMQQQHPTGAHALEVVPGCTLCPRQPSRQTRCCISWWPQPLLMICLYGQLLSFFLSAVCRYLPSTLVVYRSHLTVSHRFASPSVVKH
jgi:hypothetical protein